MTDETPAPEPDDVEGHGGKLLSARAGDDDVEGHGKYPPHLTPDDDVEGHGGRWVGATSDENDDVEGHSHRSASDSLDDPFGPAKR